MLRQALRKFRLPAQRSMAPSAFSRFASNSTTSESHQISTQTSDLPDRYKVPDYFGVHKLFTVKDLFDARVHLGHVERSLDPKMRDFVYGTRFDQIIIDLDKTSILLRQALNFIAHIAASRGIILFVVRQPHLVHLTERTAIECGEFAHCRPWKSEIFMAPKVVFNGEIRLPDLVILLSTKNDIKYDDHPVIADAAKAGIPTVGIVDSDCNPNLITFPIPGNDDTIESIQLYLHLFKQAILLGKKEIEKLDSES